MKKVKCVIWKDAEGKIHQRVLDEPVSKEAVLLWYDVPGYLEVLYLFTIKFK